MDRIPPNEERPIAWRRACMTCTKAKRQCSKQVPRCRRCQEKGLLCTYPPPRRPGTSAAVGEGETSLHLTNTALPIDEGVANQLDASGNAAFAFLQMTEADFEGFAMPTEDQPSRNPPQTSASSDALVNLRGLWFLSPESWQTEYTEPPATTSRETERSLKQYIEQARSWMRQWVTVNHSALHHRELYSNMMPRHTQDAYTAMTMYMSKTRETEATVHQILEDRVSQLLQDQDVEVSLRNASGDGLSIFNHLSRVQSLLCYQLIRLFDGDIRMRGQAESLIPTLFLWNNQMLESAKDSLAHPERFLASSPFDPTTQPNASNAARNPSLSTKFAWQAWIIAESVRRTWQTTGVVQAVYQFFKRGWSECPGHLPSTLRKALWDAPSAYSWTKALRGDRDPLLLLMVKLDEIYSRIPEDVDDFNMAIIGIYGVEYVYTSGNVP
ncbi:hypothetical protein FHL15_000022 [Xylaria flabelliformis]|uniref:Zn(2)-C6 fungal-type domain-containing protein n=1 Tax=Xylaria flabelliformis TaxID=2512241 RepID=A0A553IES6_9PEZI|nr:hypothetical protein FHL15_000022 [Xylaria flabelliformis]